MSIMYWVPVPFLFNFRNFLCFMFVIFVSFSPTSFSFQFLPNLCGVVAVLILNAHSEIRSQNVVVIPAAIPDRLPSLLIQLASTYPTAFMNYQPEFVTSFCLILEAVTVSVHCLVDCNMFGVSLLD